MKREKYKNEFDKAQNRKRKSLTFVGLLLIIATYVGSLCWAKDISEFSTYFSTFCINSLILYSYVKIRFMQKYKNKRTRRKLLKISDINKNLHLDENCIPDSIMIYNIDKGADYIKYDIYNESYSNSVKRILGLNIVVCILGIIPQFVFGTTFENIIILITQILVGLFNIVFIVFGELEYSKIEFCSIPLTNEIAKCQKRINDKYHEIMTYSIQNELIEVYGGQPYFIIQYSKEKKKYRIAMDIIFLLFCISICIFVFSRGLINILSETDNLLLIIYPNIVLIIFCMLSNRQYYAKIFEHRVYIELYSIESITKQYKKEVKQMYYEVPTVMKDNKNYIITVTELTEFDWFYSGLRGKRKGERS